MPIPIFEPDLHGFKEGVRSPFRGAAFVLKRPKLLGLCALPWAINLFVVLPVVIGVMAGLLYPWLADALPEFPAEWAQRILGPIGRLLLATVMLGAGAVLFLVVAMIVGAPFHDKVGEEIERELLAARPELLAPKLPVKAQALHALAEATRRVLVTLPRIALALLLALIPGIGPPISALFNWWVAASFATLDAFSIPMDRRGAKMPQKMAWLRANRSFALGFGLPILVVPCAFFLMPPIAAAAASLVYCEKLLAGEGEKDGVSLKASEAPVSSSSSTSSSSSPTE